MPKRLSKSERMLLLKFVCAFAWADFRVDEPERNFIRKLVHELQLSDDERDQVEAWLEEPPRPEDVDPNQIPLEHRKRFVDAARSVVSADGRVNETEWESFETFERLLAKD
jgi:uncharacterized tellurite resistance protein B-like protein